MKNGWRWNFSNRKERDKRIWEMHERGMTNAQIAQEFSLTSQRICQLMKILDARNQTKSDTQLSEPITCPTR
jgi:DNA-binding NarL/FixJ family response regulator